MSVTIVITKDDLMKGLAREVYQKYKIRLKNFSKCSIKNKSDKGKTESELENIIMELSNPDK